MFFFSVCKCQNLRILYIYRKAQHDSVNTKSDVMYNFKFYHGIFKFQGKDTFIFFTKTQSLLSLYPKTVSLSSTPDKPSPLLPPLTPTPPTTPRHGDNATVKLSSRSHHLSLAAASCGAKFA